MWPQQIRADNDGLIVRPSRRSKMIFACRLLQRPLDRYQPRSRTVPDPAVSSGLYRSASGTASDDRSGS